MENERSNQARPLGEVTVAGFLSASDEVRTRWTYAIKMLTSRQRGITRTIENADERSRLKDVFKDWPQGVADLPRHCNVASCRALSLEAEFARLARIPVADVHRAMHGDAECGPVHGRTLVVNMLIDLSASSGGGEAPAFDEPGYLVKGRYRLLKRLGAGGFGVAWLAKPWQQANSPPGTTSPSSMPANSTCATTSILTTWSAGRGFRW